MQSSTRRKARYGKKSGIVSDAASAIFGKETSPLPESPDPKKPVSRRDVKTSETTITKRSRPALDDVTELLNNITLDEPKRSARTPKTKSSSAATSQSPLRRSPRRQPAAEPHQLQQRKTPAKASKPAKVDERLTWLKPLIDAYEKKSEPGQGKISIQKWDTLLDKDWALDKIAESSFAEVYKVSNNFGTSILKIMALRPPKGPGSQRETSIPVEMVLSEVLIMNTMTDLNGFVEFKEAHVIEGRPPKALTDAFFAFAEEKETYFPKPSSYPRGQLFLALELGDAGTDVEHFHIDTAAQLWDIFLGVVTALATGEQAHGFEHRDLHEGNVCLRQTHPAHALPKPNGSPSRLGYSGLEVTLLDYTLSRAEDAHTVMHLDLEEDKELFASSDILQRQIYRRMRNWVFFRTHGVSHPLFDREGVPQCGSWQDFEPYTNVLWIYYVLDYIVLHFEGAEAAKRRFLTETEEVRQLLGPDVRAYDGGFSDALGVFEFCVGKGWIPEG